MKKILIPLIIITFSLEIAFGKYTLVSIDISDNSTFNKLLELHLDLETANKSRDKIQVIVNDYELEDLKNNDFKFQVLIPEYEKFLEYQISQSKISVGYNFPLAFKLGSMAGFYKLNEVYQQFDEIITEYPEFFVAIDTIGWSWENRPIIAYSFGNSGSNLPEVLITALHHSREPGTITNITYFLTKALQQARAENDEYKNLFKNFRIWFVPVVNPDGYAYNESKYPNGGGLWRKNRRKINDSTFGVDLNRNYGPYEFWNAPNKGSSTNPKNETYRGTEPFSEPETRAIRDFTYRHNFRIALNFHTFGGMVIYPFSAINQQTPDSNFYRAFSNFITNYIGYYFGNDLTTVGYPTRGSSDDWFYLQDSLKGKVIAFTVESGYNFDGFWPPIDRIVEISEDNLNIIKETIFSATSNIRPEILTYFFDTVTKVGSLSLKLTNIGISDLIYPTYVQIVPLSEAISIEKNDTTLFYLPAGAGINFYNRVHIPKENFMNGTLVPFQISILQNGFWRKDTLFCRLYDYNSISPIESSFWISDNWGYEVDSITHFPILTDSPYKNYSDSAENYITLRNPIKLNTNSSELEIEMKWEIEPFYDFFEIEISTDNGNSWESLRSNRSVPGSGNANGRQERGHYGFAGIYPFWVTQIFDLEKYLNKTILIRMSLLSDRAKNYDGIKLRKIELRSYGMVDFSNYTTVKENSNIQRIFIQSNKLVSPSVIEIQLPTDHLSVEIYDIIGNLIHKQELSNNNGRSIFQINPSLPNGIYILKIYSDQNLYSLPLLFW